LQQLKSRIKEWNKSAFGKKIEQKVSFKQEMQNLEEELESKGLSKELIRMENELASKLDDIYKNEDTFWKKNYTSNGCKMETKIPSSCIELVKVGDLTIESTKL
jgi:hypothetical protein